MKVVQGNFGRVEFRDCLEGLQELEDNSFDLLLTDPSYNTGLKKSRAHCMTNASVKNRVKKVHYTDNMTEEEYWQFCEEWWKEAKRVCKHAVFTPGYKNFRQWLRLDDFWYVFHINTDRQGGCPVAKLNKLEPTLVWNYGQVFKWNIYLLPFSKDPIAPISFCHPCPKPILFWKWIIESCKPESVLDIFCGSGVTVQACEEMKIKYLCYEILEEYEPDIQLRLKLGQTVKPITQWIKKVK